MEDEPLIRYVVEDTLTDAGGFVVLTAGSSEQAYALLEQRPDIQVVFTDQNMPGELSGTALAHIIHRKWPDIAILVTTGSGLLEAKLPEGARFVSKPYNTDTIPAEIRSLLAERLASSPLPDAPLSPRHFEAAPASEPERSAEHPT